MFNVVQQLRQDHKHCLQVLHCLEVHLRRLCETPGLAQAYPELDAIESAFEYLSEYPDGLHHPLEESLLYELEHQLDDDQVQQMIHDLRVQHICLVDGTRQLQEALAEFLAVPRLVEPDHPANKKAARALLAGFQDYQSLQTAHIQIENDRLLPLIERHISARQLEKFARHHQYREDPMFGSNRRQRFDALRARIVDQAAPL